MARILDVYLKEQLVGHLEQDDFGSLGFRYGDSWLASESPTPLSHSLPLRSEPFRRNECRPFFAGLLPEEISRELIAKAFGVSDKNDFAILERIGGECAGAVSLMPSGEHPIAEKGRYREISSETCGEDCGTAAKAASCRTGRDPFVACRCSRKTGRRNFRPKFLSASGWFTEHAHFEASRSSLRRTG
jgi:HipA-like protein